MRIILCLIIYLISFFYSSAQKKLLDHSVPYSWPVISSQKISNDGKFLCYTIGSKRGNFNTEGEVVDSILVVVKSDNSWKTEIPRPKDIGFFTDNNRNLVVNVGMDSLCILHLTTGKTDYVGQVASSKIPEEGNSSWIAWNLKDINNTLILRSLLSGEEKKFSHVIDYVFSNSGQFLVVQELDTSDGKKSNILLLVDRNNGKAKTISYGDKAINVVFNEKESKLAFLTVNGIDEIVQTLEYYQIGTDSSKVLVDSHSLQLKSMSLARGKICFSKDGNKVFFTVGRQVNPPKKNELNSGAKVDLWNYKSATTLDFEENSPFLSVIDLDSNSKVIRLQQDSDRFEFRPGHIDEKTFHVLFQTNQVGGNDEYNWRESSSPDIYLVSVRDASRVLLKKQLIGYLEGFSPSGKYVVWYDKLNKHWVSYNINRNTTRNITLDIHTHLNQNNDYPGLAGPEGLAGWLANDDAVLIYDRYDIWKVDLDGIKPPLNVTHYYGIKNKTKLRLLNFKAGYQAPVTAIHLNDTLLLSGFNESNKNNGFFKLVWGPDNSIEKLIMDSNVYYFSTPYPSILGAYRPFQPLKAKCASVYLLTKSCATEYPDLVLTCDFRHFEPVTKLEPQKQYNWYSSQLIHWKVSNNQDSDGILYKPENFDPRKKYPVIFYYYEKCSDNLNFFIHPELSDGIMSIPWFVSNGYLVFVPDIQYVIGHPGESALNYIVSAASYLKKYSWVDGRHMGIQGHSYGGWETNYIITHSNMFAAAASAEGLSDLVSDYGAIGTIRGRENAYFETNQGRIGASLWQKPGLYLINSPIFKADKVSTPLLILQNRGDKTVPFHQGGAELYSALYRLGKKVWMLSYDGEGHTIEDKTNALDYSIRLSQFFDHYLKHAPAPKWMTSVIPSRLKGIEYGLELDLEDEKNGEVRK